MAPFQAISRIGRKLFCFLFHRRFKISFSCFLFTQRIDCFQRVLFTSQHYTRNRISICFMCRATVHVYAMQWNRSVNKKHFSDLWIYLFTSFRDFQMNLSLFGVNRIFPHGTIVIVENCYYSKWKGNWLTLFCVCNGLYSHNGYLRCKERISKVWWFC